MDLDDFSEKKGCLRKRPKVRLLHKLKIHPIFNVGWLKPYHPDMEDPTRGVPTGKDNDFFVEGSGICDGGTQS